MQYGSKRMHTKYHLVHDNLAYVDFTEMLNFWSLRLKNNYRNYTATNLAAV